MEKVRAPTSIAKDKELKARIKKTVRKELEKNPKLTKFLEENHAKGRFIKNVTNRSISNPFTINLINSADPINHCLHWDETKEEWIYWARLHDEYMRK